VLAAGASGALAASIQRLVLASDQNLGHLERPAAHDGQELLRQTVERWWFPVRILVQRFKAKSPGRNRPGLGEKTFFSRTRDRRSRARS
jgi:hypothetical protein